MNLAPRRWDAPFRWTFFRRNHEVGVPVVDGLRSAEHDGDDVVVGGNECLGVVDGIEGALPRLFPSLNKDHTRGFGRKNYGNNGAILFSPVLKRSSGVKRFLEKTGNEIAISRKEWGGRGVK